MPLAGERRPAIGGVSKGGGFAPHCDREVGSESGMPPTCDTGKSAPTAFPLMAGNPKTHAGSLQPHLDQLDHPVPPCKWSRWERRGSLNRHPGTLQPP